ncbi:MAG: amino acid ABC transporter permease [Ruminococcaceae bacterium]|nr:amino acid ABC transporter permease [Oscillospiraceae bacterium]
MFLPVTLRLLEGFGESLKIFALTLLFALPGGLIISFGSMSKFKPLKAVVRFVVWIVRGTPLMLQLLIIFYGPGLILPSVAEALPSGVVEVMPVWLYQWMLAPPLLDRFAAAIVAFSLNYACYFSEIYRGGIEGVPYGQYEAGQVLGMTKSQVFFKVVLMQVVKRILAPMSNEVITLVKDTSLARVISIYEIIWAGESFIKKGMIWPLFYTGAFYLIFSALLTWLFGKFEKKLSYYKI